MSGRLSADLPTRGRIIAAFGAIYFIWGSTFLATKLALRHLPPVLFSGSRFFLAGLLLTAVGLLMRERFPRTPREWGYMLLLSVLMITCSNGFTTFSMQHIASNEAALLAASNALWIAGLGAFGHRAHTLSMRAVVGLLLGFLGVVLLMWPRADTQSGHAGWQLLALTGSLSWSIGTIVYRNALLPMGPIAFNAVLMIAGGAWLLLAGLISGEAPRWNWHPGGLLPLLYMAVFASAVSYTAYTYLLGHTSADRVATFAYVNPAVATLLGWAVLGETLSPAQLAGMLVILAAVALVTMPSRVASSA